MEAAQPFIDSRTRSIIKAISWRGTGTAATVLIVFIFTGKLDLSIEVGMFEFISKIGLFYVHERIWNRIR